MKKKQSLKELLDGWLAFNDRWFYDPASGLYGAMAIAIIIVAALLAWGVAQ